ncbi:helix-turn-helix transcriptional regulator [Haliangium ochraceum]|uniref:Transcriptional regulator, XRE family n=1 Tax=Haliangium ochraceum (strain DSM 14365 / JCM 11303 / SMP-2) TaxID=502025 RepID=D0LND0_HALO1|nr:helix-turn-helix transcriptional regulator [Haliangium ochraceum]ACY15307.1 transcriptional regulator, XRE family [Haliangium ochraceum DSM 14365]
MSNAPDENERLRALFLQRLPPVLTEARMERGWTQADVAEQLGVSLAYYGRIERGDHVPSFLMTVKLARLFALSLDGLLDPEGWRVPATQPHAVQLDEEPKAMRRLRRRVRNASPRALRIVEEVLDKLAAHSTDAAAVSRAAAEPGQRGTEPR